MHVFRDISIPKVFSSKPEKTNSTNTFFVFVPYFTISGHFKLHKGGGTYYPGFEPTLFCRPIFKTQQGGDGPTLAPDTYPAVKWGGGTPPLSIGG